MSEKTAEQIAAEKLAKEQAKADRAAARASAKADREAAKAKAKAEAAAAKQAKRDAKAAEKAKVTTNDQPVQNDVRRPKAGTKCGQAWSVFDSISAELGAPAPIGPSLEKTRALGLNDGNVRAEYAR